MSNLGGYINTYGLVTQKIAFAGSAYGEEAVLGSYPYAVSRNGGEVRRLGEQRFQVWESTLENSKYDSSSYISSQQEWEKLKTMWSSQRAEAMRLFASAYTNKYLEIVAEKDKETGRAQPQPAATPSNTAKLQGATLTLKRVEHNADECVYFVEVEDPGYLDGVLSTEIVSPLGEAEQPQATSSYGMAGMAASDASPSYHAPLTPLPASRKSKGTRLYLRNVKKK